MADLPLAHIFRSILLSVCLIAGTLLVICLSGCSDDRISTDDLKGKWVVTDALRNDKRTATLEDAYFFFQTDSTFVTNLFAEEKEFEYVLTPEGFSQSGDISISYKIETLKADTLILATEINQYKFYLMTIRDTSQVEILSN